MQRLLHKPRQETSVKSIVPQTAVSCQAFDEKGEILNIYYIENVVNNTMTCNCHDGIQLFQTDSSKTDFQNQNTINGNNNANINISSPKGNYIAETFDKLTFSQRVKVLTLIAKLLKENQ